MKTLCFIFILSLVFNLLQAQDYQTLSTNLIYPIQKEEPRLNNYFLWVYSHQNCSILQDQNIFLDTNVYSFFSSNFINYKINIDSLYLIVNFFDNINSTGLFFYDSIYNLIHQVKRFPNNSEQLIEIGRNALDPSRCYKGIIEEYEKGTRDPSFLMKYLKIKKWNYEIISSDIDLFKQTIVDTNDYSAEIESYLYDYFFCLTDDYGYYYFDVNSLPFKILLIKRNELIKRYSQSQIDMRINALANFQLNNLISNGDSQLLIQVSKYLNNSYKSFDIKDTDSTTLLILKGYPNDTVNKVDAILAFHFLQQGDTTNFKARIDKYISSTSQNSSGLYFVANYLYRNINDVTFMQMAEGFLLKAYSIDPHNYKVIGLLCEIWYEKGDFDLCRQLIDSAIQMHFENNINSYQLNFIKKELNNK